MSKLKLCFSDCISIEGTANLLTVRASQAHLNSNRHSMKVVSISPQPRGNPAPCFCAVGSDLLSQLSEMWNWRLCMGGEPRLFTTAPRLSKNMLVALLLLLSLHRPKNCPWLQFLMVRYTYEITEPWLWIVALFDYWVVCTYSWLVSDFVLCKNSHSPNCSQAWYRFF